MPVSPQGESAGVPELPKDRSSDETWQRRHPRSAVLWAAQLETADGRRIECAVLDLSMGGAKLMIEHSFVGGEIVTLASHRFGVRRARIVWTEPHRIGLQFQESGIAVGATPAADSAPTTAPSPRLIRSTGVV